jgi:hypothetical protein
MPTNEWGAYGPNPGEPGYHECERCDYERGLHECPYCGKEHLPPRYIAEEEKEAVKLLESQPGAAGWSAQTLRDMGGLTV